MIIKFLKSLFKRSNKKQTNQKNYPDLYQYIDIEYHPKNSPITLQKVDNTKAVIEVLSKDGRVHFRVVNPSKGESIKPSTDGKYYFRSTAGRRLVLTEKILGEIVTAFLEGRVYKA